MNSRVVFQKCTFVLCFKRTLFAAKNNSFVFCACVHPKVWLSSGFEIAFFTSKCQSIMLGSSVNSQCIFWTCLMSTLFTRKNDSLVLGGSVNSQCIFWTCLMPTLFTRKNDSLVFFLDVFSDCFFDLSCIHIDHKRTMNFHERFLYGFLLEYVGLPYIHIYCSYMAFLRCVSWYVF